MARRASALLVAALCAGAGAAWAQTGGTPEAEEPAAEAPLARSPALARAGMVDARRYARTIELDVRYATANNFTGRRLPGYCEPWAFLRRDAARRLGRVQAALEEDDLGLVVFDAYRPARASRAMVRWAERTGNERVLREGYVARRSNHARGTTVDVTLRRLDSNGRLGMGTAYDAFTVRSHTMNATGRALRNRVRLRRAMAMQGFSNYAREWWHYDLPPTAPRRDISLGCSR